MSNTFRESIVRSSAATPIVGKINGPQTNRKETREERASIVVRSPSLLLNLSSASDTSKITRGVHCQISIATMVQIAPKAELNGRADSLRNRFKTRENRPVCSFSESLQIIPDMTGLKTSGNPKSNRIVFRNRGHSSMENATAIPITSSTKVVETTKMTVTFAALKNESSADKR